MTDIRYNGKSYTRGVNKAEDIVYNETNVKNELDRLNSNIDEQSKNCKAYTPLFGTAYGRGSIADALNVNAENVGGDENKVGYVYKGGATNLPSDCSHGIREVYYYNANNIHIKIVGADTNGRYREWGNSFNGVSWTGWRANNSNDYLTDEVMVGTWIDGKPYYRKVFQFNALGSYPLNIANATKYWVMNDSVLFRDFGQVIAINNYNIASADRLNIFIQDGSVFIRGEGQSGTLNFVVPVYYQKSTD